MLYFAIGERVAVARQNEQRSHPKMLAGDQVRIGHSAAWKNLSEAMSEIAARRR
jgi:hypothetical protein